MNTNLYTHLRRLAATLCLCTAVAAAAWAQPAITFETAKRSIGQIEWKKPVQVFFKVKNTGNQPLVLTKVMPDCACSTAEWTKQPIHPQGEGSISILFDAEMLGRFEKHVEVYTNAQPNIALLTFRGEVVRQVKQPTAPLPFSFSEISLGKNRLFFPDVYRGEQITLSLPVQNNSSTPYAPTLMHLPSFLSAQADPDTLLPGRRGEIRVTLSSKDLPDYGLTQTTVYLARKAGDTIGKENALPVRAILLPDFSGLSHTDSLMAPAIYLSEKVIDLSHKLKHSLFGKASKKIIVANRGKRALHISKIQLFDPSVEVNIKKTTLAPGEELKMKVSVRRRKDLPKESGILLITNDPISPKVEIEIKK